MGGINLYHIKFRCPNTQAAVYFLGSQPYLTPWAAGTTPRQAKIRYYAIGV